MHLGRFMHFSQKVVGVILNVNLHEICIFQDIKFRTNLITMALIQVSQTSSDNEVCQVKWKHFYNKIVNE